MAITIERKLNDNFIYPTRDKWLETQYQARPLNRQLISATSGVSGITLDAGLGFSIPDVNAKIVLTGSEIFTPETRNVDSFYYILLSIDRVTGVQEIVAQQFNTKRSDFAQGEVTYQYPLVSIWLRPNTTDFTGVPIFKYDDQGKIHAEIKDESREYLLVADGTTAFENDRVFIEIPKQIEDAEIETIVRGNSNSPGAKFSWRLYLDTFSTDHNTALNLAKAAPGDPQTETFFADNSGRYYNGSFNFGWIKSRMRVNRDIGGRLILTHETTENNLEEEFKNYQNGKVTTNTTKKMNFLGFKFTNYVDADPNEINPEFLWLGIKLKEL